MSLSKTYEPSYEKTNNLGLVPGLTQNRLYSHYRSRLEVKNFRGADQLCSYCTAYLHLCFCICKLLFFLCGCSHVLPTVVELSGKHSIAPSQNNRSVDWDVSDHIKLSFYGLKQCDKAFLAGNETYHQILINNHSSPSGFCYLV